MSQPFSMSKYIEEKKIISYTFIYNLYWEEKYNKNQINFVDINIKENGKYAPTSEKNLWLGYNTVWRCCMEIKTKRRKQNVGSVEVGVAHNMQKDQ